MVARTTVERLIGVTGYGESFVPEPPKRQRQHRTSDIVMRPPPRLQRHESGKIMWTDHAREWVRDAWEAELSAAEIGRRLGITKNAVVGAAHRLKVDRRPSPIRNAARAAKDDLRPSAWAQWFDALSRENRVGMCRRNHTLGCPATLSKPGRHLWDCTCGTTLPPGSIAAAVVPREPLPPPAPAPVPLRVVVQAPPPRPVPEPPARLPHQCLFPLWGHGQRPQFRDGRPLLCYAPAEGVWCATHRAVCFARVVA